jgi:hypothetical protein
VGQSCLLSTSSIKFLTTRSLKSQIYLAPHEDNRLLSTVRSRKWKNNFMVHLKLHQLFEKLLAIWSELST